MTTKPEEQSGGVPPLKHWEDFSAAIVNSGKPINPGAAAVKRIGLEKAAKAIHLTVLDQSHVAICHSLEIDPADYTALVLLFSREIRRAKMGRKRREYEVAPKASRKTADPKVLESRLRKLGSMIPKKGGGTYADESPELVVDAALRLGKRILCRLEAI